MENQVKTMQTSIESKFDTKVAAMQNSIESKLDTKIKVIQDDQIQLKTTTDVI